MGVCSEPKQVSSPRYRWLSYSSTWSTAPSPGYVLVNAEPFPQSRAVPPEDGGSLTQTDSFCSTVPAQMKTLLVS